MIPKIITTNEGDSDEEIILRFATQEGIDLSHRVIVRPEKDELTLDQIHLMQKDIQVIFSKKLLVVFLAVDNSSNEVQNSLLKCLEEDSDRIQFLFLVRNPTRLVSTILSRCTVIEHKVVQKQSEIMANGHDLFSFVKNSDISKNEAVERIDTFLLSKSMHTQKLLCHVLKIRKLILDNNMNPVLGLDSILLFLSKTSTMKVS